MSKGSISEPLCQTGPLILSLIKKKNDDVFVGMFWRRSDPCNIVQGETILRAGWTVSWHLVSRLTLWVSLEAQQYMRSRAGRAKGRSSGENQIISWYLEGQQADREREEVRKQLDGDPC